MEVEQVWEQHHKGGGKKGKKKEKKGATLRRMRAEGTESKSEKSAGKGKG